MYGNIVLADFHTCSIGCVESKQRSFDLDSLFDGNKRVEDEEAKISHIHTQLQLRLRQRADSRRVELVGAADDQIENTLNVGSHQRR